MINSLLPAAVLPVLIAGLWAQAASPLTDNPPDYVNATVNHAREPVGFEIMNGDGRDPNHPSLYPDEVVSAIQKRWYQAVSGLRQASYDRQGGAVVEFTVKRDGGLAKIAIAEKSGEGHLDSAALNAVRSASPFNPFPKGYTSKSTRFRIHLGYNQPIPGDTCPTMFPAVCRAHDGTTTPRATYSPDPEYSEDGRKAKYQGTTVLGVTVGVDGLPYDVCVVNALGFGLDDRAIEAVKHWKFEPGVKDGHPVPVRVSVEVDFHIY